MKPRRRLDNLTNAERTTLTQRQLHILRLHATRRLTQQQIADALGITRSSVDTHYRRALTKLNRLDEGEAA
jgi:RNA polymerase sigma factor (sigma-70 family)